MRITAKVSGGDKFSEKLRGIAEPKKILPTIKKNGTEMQRHAKILAPVDTGFLKRHIRLYVEKGGWQVRVVSEAEYAGIQERKYTAHIEPALIRQRTKFLNDIRRAINGG